MCLCTWIIKNEKKNNDLHCHFSPTANHKSEATRREAHTVSTSTQCRVDHKYFCHLYYKQQQHQQQKQANRVCLFLLSLFLLFTWSECTRNIIGWYEYPMFPCDFIYLSESDPHFQFVYIWLPSVVLCIFPDFCTLWSSLHYAIWVNFS